jgi:hypothetical protein
MMHQSNQSISAQVKAGAQRAMSIIGGLLVLLSVVLGIAILQNIAQGAEWQKSKRIGLLLLAAGITVLYLTVRRWARFFVVISGVTAAKFLVSAITGRFWTGGREVSRAVAIEHMLLLATITALSFQFMEREPRTRLEFVGLVWGVVAVLWSAISSNIIPVVSAVTLLAVLRLLAETQES